jgi:hypothetical protein
MFLQELCLAEQMVRIQILSRCPEHSGIAEKSDLFCPNPLGPRAFVWAASITPLTFAQTAHPSVRIQASYRLAKLAS